MPAQTAYRFDRKLPRNLPLLIQFSVTNKAKKDNVRRLILLFVAQYASNKVNMRRISSIFIANIAENENLYISKGGLG
jgi:hypothetical protein